MGEAGDEERSLAPLRSFRAVLKRGKELNEA